MTEQRKIELPVIYGTKAGMTRVFDSTGNHVPVTVIKLESNVISQVKTEEKDGYNAYQIAYCEKKESIVTKPTKGHLAKSSTSKGFSRFSEIRVDKALTDALGCEVSLESLKDIQTVDVTGISKGKGFQGVMKRYHFSGGPASHGSSFHRAPGSIGNRATPARVFKLKKMPGHMGSRVTTAQNLTVIEVNIDKGYLLIKGAVPGAKNSYVKIAKALKK